jgi:threonine dehydrogenase-like Zn-dependent dehydrogenase
LRWRSSIAGSEDRTHFDFVQGTHFLPDVLEGRIQPGRVFHRVIGLDEVPAGYRAMDDRKAIKVIVKP